MSEFDFTIFSKAGKAIRVSELVDLADIADFVQRRLFSANKLDCRLEFVRFMTDSLKKGGGALHKFANKANSTLPIPAFVNAAQGYSSKPDVVLEFYRKIWKHIWHIDNPDTEAQLLADGEVPPFSTADSIPLDFLEFVKAIRSYGSKALGIDHWDMKEWGMGNAT